VDRPGGDTWDAASTPPRLVPHAGSLAARLDAWLADARVEDSADARARERWLAAAAESDATFAGVLLDLAERGVPLAVATPGGRRLHGRAEVLGADFVSLRVPAGTEVLVPLGGISSVRTAPSEVPAVGERVVTTELRLADVLGELAAERQRALLVLRGGSEAVSGELRSVGRDVVTVRTDGEPAGTAYVPLVAIVEVALD
jgi:hypothetical protein